MRKAFITHFLTDLNDFIICLNQKFLRLFDPDIVQIFHKGHIGYILKGSGKIIGTNIKLL